MNLTQTIRGLSCLSLRLLKRLNVGDVGADSAFITEHDLELGPIEVTREKNVYNPNQPTMAKLLIACPRKHYTGQSSLGLQTLSISFTLEI